MNQSRFRPVKHIKMTVRISVSWKMNIHMAKKWPEMVIQRSFIKGHSSGFTFINAYPEYTFIHCGLVQLQSSVRWSKNLLIVISRKDRRSKTSKENNILEFYLGYMIDKYGRVTECWEDENFWILSKPLNCWFIALPVTCQRCVVSKATE